MENLDRLIEILCKERNERIPKLKDREKADYFRALCNVRPPVFATDEFIKLQDEYLTELKKQKGVCDISKMTYRDNIAVFKGDITTLNADAIVNAANSRMLGCFRPLHNCIDNAIHSAAGIQARRDCNKIMQGGEADNGDVIITKAYNLPSKYIFHTVGPVISGKVSAENRADLKKCYKNCLKKAADMKLTSIAFCSISTGVFGYPKEAAAEVAVETTKEFLSANGDGLSVIFDVFTEEDYEIYRRILG